MILPTAERRQGPPERRGQRDDANAAGDDPRGARRRGRTGLPRRTSAQEPGGFHGAAQSRWHLTPRQMRRFLPEPSRSQRIAPCRAKSKQRHPPYSSRAADKVLPRARLHHAAGAHRGKSRPNARRSLLLVRAAVNRGTAEAAIIVSTALYVEWGRLGEIGDLCVLPEHRRRGLTRLLIEHLRLSPGAQPRALGAAEPGERQKT